MTPTEMLARRETLLAARFGGVHRVESEGRRSTCTTDVEVAAVVGDLERRMPRLRPEPGGGSSTPGRPSRCDGGGTAGEGGLSLIYSDRGREIPHGDRLDEQVPLGASATLAEPVQPRQPNS